MSDESKELCRVFEKLQEYQLTFTDIIIIAGVSQGDMFFGFRTSEAFQDFLEDGTFEGQVKRIFPDIPIALGDENLGDNEYCAGILNWLIENERLGFIIKAQAPHTPQLINCYKWFYGEALMDVADQAIQWRKEMLIFLDSMKQATKKKGR